MPDIRTSPRPLSECLVGSWELVSREDRTRSGALRDEPHLGSDPVALLIYDRGGRFAAQFMKRDRSVAAPAAAAGAAPNNSRAMGGYDAYFGTYTVDDAAGTVTQRLMAALAPENVGQVLTRAMTVTGDQLVIGVDTADASGEPLVRTLRFRRVA